MKFDQPIQLIPEYRDYVWGGKRLRPGMLTAEAWVIFEGDKIRPPFPEGVTLRQLAADHPLELLGSRAVARTGTRFPLLIKLLDTVQWLSLQVHPDDAWAERLEGPGNFGKTEAWHILEGLPDASVLAGIKPGVTPESLAQAVGTKEILELVERIPVRPGDTVYMPAGAIHAIGPDLLLYEVQQTSDLTYRVYDWDRPQTGGRVLHLEQARKVAKPEARGQVTHLTRDARQVVAVSPYFKLERLGLGAGYLEMDTLGERFHALTVINGQVRVQFSAGELSLGRFESLVIPAALGPYRLQSESDFSVLKASANPPT